MTTHLKEQMLSLTGLLAILIVAYFSYYPGLGGLFIFDDFPNLSTLGQYPALSTWDNFWLFLLEGDSGPSGRPVSLASFYLNDIAWPSSPSSFTRTNLWIHLLNGVLIYWFLNLLAQTLKLSATKTTLLATFGTAFWLLHPLHTNTVLYIIQRMTELSALFTLAALIFYLYGRRALIDSPVKGASYLSFGVGLSLLLAIFSKENAILFLVYVLSIEFFLFSPLNVKTPRLLKYWLIPFILAPFLLLVAYLMNRGIQNIGYSERDFNAYERLLTESRVLFDYLHHILLPRIGDTSLFHDDYLLSRGILDPWTTLPSVIGIIGLTAGMFFYRKKYPLIAFAIAWFLGGHLLESTTLSLEIYFEHRNYLPMFGFVFATAWYIAHAPLKQRSFVYIGASFIILLFGFLTYANASLWSKPAELITNWHIHHPQSQRVQEAYKLVIGELPKSNALPSSNFREKRGMKTYLSLQHLKQQCETNQLRASTLQNYTSIFENGKIISSSIDGLDNFMQVWLQDKCSDVTSRDLSEFLELAIHNQAEIKNKTFIHMTHYWLYYLYSKQRNFSKAMQNLEIAYRLKPSVELLLLQGRVLSSAGLQSKAIERLRETQTLEKTFKKKMSLKIRQKEINALIESIRNHQ